MPAPNPDREHLTAVLDGLRRRVDGLKAIFTHGTMQRQCVATRVNISQLAEFVAEAKTLRALRTIAGLVDIEAKRVEWLESLLKTHGPAATLIG
jgi:hypothetical protein